VAARLDIRRGLRRMDTLLPALAGAIGVGAEMEIDGLTDAAYYRALAIAEAIDGPAPAVGFV